MANQPLPPFQQQSPPQIGAAPQQQQQPQVFPSEEQTNQSINDLKNNAEAKNKIPVKLQQFIDSENIAEDLDEKTLDEIAASVIAGYRLDEESRTEWKAWMDKAFDLLKHTAGNKNSPWEGSANIKYPLIMGSCIQFNARTNPEIIRDDKVVEVRLMSDDDPQHMLSNRADRLSKHMSYQLLVQSKHWIRDTDKLLMMLPMMGTVYRKTFFNPINGHPDTQVCLPDEIIVNNNIRSLSEARRITHKIPMSSNELIEHMRAGLFIEYPIDELTSPTAVEDAAENITQDGQTDAMSSVMHDIIEQHRFLDLDDDGYQEPYIVTLHEASEKVLRIKARYDRNSFEFNKKGEITKINPDHHFISYHLIPNPDGTFHSLGFGMLLYHLNETSNSILNQLLDAGVLANRQSGFIGKGLRVPKGDYRFKPGEWKLVASSPGTQISQNIVPMPTKEPSQVLFSLLQFLIQAAQPLTALSDVMQGEAPAPATPAATTLALIDQGQKIFSAILERIYNSLKEEFEKLYELNKKYLDEEETFPLAMDSGMITIADYKAPNYGIYPVADPKLSSGMQRLMKAQALMQLIDDPDVNSYEIKKNYLEALHVTNIDAILPPPNPNPPPSPEELMLEAKIQNTKVDTAEKLVNMEVDLGNLEVARADQQSRAANYGIQATDSKVDSIVKLAEMEQQIPEPTIQRAFTEEEALGAGVQMAGMPPELEQRLTTIEGIVSQLLGPIGQQLMGTTAGEGQQPPPAGAPQETTVEPEALQAAATGTEPEEMPTEGQEPPPEGE